MPPPTTLPVIARKSSAARCGLNGKKKSNSAFLLNGGGVFKPGCTTTYDMPPSIVRRNIEPLAVGPAKNYFPEDLFADSTTTFSTT